MSADSEGGLRLHEEVWFLRLYILFNDNVDLVEIYEIWYMVDIFYEQDDECEDLADFHNPYRKTSFTNFSYKV